jgi:hypothetical protein
VPVGDMLEREARPAFAGRSGTLLDRWHVSYGPERCLSLLKAPQITHCLDWPRLAHDELREPAAQVYAPREALGGSSARKPVLRIRRSL